ncbi:peroxiredoxin [Motilibacter rhizosphaerae]|uniref:Peroxiredoxin n=1 Tax=Motilibacter rhizosphaerae TaxID=598652 RepID=A0A4Q7NRV2_9ACTN|nr:redoxin domain-containing protein [Motilibacter rhizosphaerae]RZS89644.1 peroxiredoxin [Motilibacter rhizosphaerae]
MTPAGSPPQVGTAAPAFTLEDTHGTPVELASLRGRPVLLVFFPHAFTPLCTGELDDLRDAADLEGVQVLGICCDPAESLRAFADQQGYVFPLLSDFWPHGAVATAYGVLFEPRGFATRASFLLDADGVVRWSVVNGPGDTRDVTAYADALAALAGAGAGGAPHPLP